MPALLRTAFCSERYGHYARQPQPKRLARKALTADHVPPLKGPERASEEPRSAPAAPRALRNAADAWQAVFDLTGLGRRYATGWQALGAFGAKSVGIFVGI